MGLRKLVKNALSGHWESTFGKGLGGTLNDLTGATDMYNKEYKGNVALWNMQNEYNTPAAQIARMAQAGIDVNPMTYAVGNGNMSTSAGNISTPSVSASGVNPVATVMSVLEGIQSLKVNNQQIRNMQAAEDALNQKTSLDFLNGFVDYKGKLLAQQISKWNYDWARDHNVPLNQMPGAEASATSYLNRILGEAAKGTSSYETQEFGYENKDLVREQTNNYRKALGAIYENRRRSRKR